MRIRCPACAATYDVPDALLATPRTVRCARCTHDWTPEPIVEPGLVEELEPPHAEAAEREDIIDDAIEPPTGGLMAEHMPHEPEPEVAFGDTPLSAIERLSVPGDLSPRIRRRDRLLTAAWAASFATLTALGVAGYTERDALMREWPASKRVYATLGLAQSDFRAQGGQGGDSQGGDTKGSTLQSGATSPTR